jgi:hypothetical protein
MAMSINKIRKALDAALLAVVGLPQLQTENTYFNAGVDPWCRSMVIPAQSIPVLFGAGVTLQVRGIYQVDLFYPGAGNTDEVSAVADAICQAFFVGSQFSLDDQVVTVTNITQFGASVDAGLNYCVPLRIEFSSYVKAN